MKKFHKLIATIKTLNKQNESPALSKSGSYWCHQLLDLVIAFFLLGAISSMILSFVDVKICPSSFDTFVPFRGQCYQIFNETRSWSEARTHCNLKGGYLLELYTPSELDYVTKLLTFSDTTQKSFWLGASDHGSPKIFLWNVSEREPSFHISWAPGFPAERSSKTTCTLMLNDDNYTWINTECYEEANYICKLILSDEEKPAKNESDAKIDGNHSTTISPISSDFPLHSWAMEAHNGASHFFAFSTNTSLIWSQARDFCLEKAQ